MGNWIWKQHGTKIMWLTWVWISGRQFISKNLFLCAHDQVNYFGSVPEHVLIFFTYLFSCTLYLRSYSCSLGLNITPGFFHSCLTHFYCNDISHWLFLFLFFSEGPMLNWIYLAISYLLAAATLDNWCRLFSILLLFLELYWCTCSMLRVHHVPSTYFSSHGLQSY